MDNNNPATIPGKRKRLSAKKSLLLMLLIFFVMVNIFAYVNIRSRWVNKSHPYPKAKEYLALGEMVFLYRKGLNIIFKVDNPVMYPLNKLQEAIYNRGTRYIPETDGEPAVWKYKLDLYFYVRKDYLPNYDTPKTAEAVSPLRARSLNDVYSTLEVLGTKPIADREMDEIRYKVFPLLSSYYGIRQLCYFGNRPHPSVGLKLINDREHVDRNMKLVDWLIAVREEWDRRPALSQAVRRAEPQIEMFYYDALISLLDRIILRRALDLDLRCNDRYVSLYLSTKESLMELLGRKTGGIPQGQKKLVYQMNFETYRTRLLAYALNKYCQVPKDQAYPDRCG